MRDRHHDEAMSELFQDDPNLSVAYLNSLIEDGDQADLLVALRQMTKAFGEVSAIAEGANLNATQVKLAGAPYLCVRLSVEVC